MGTLRLDWRFKPDGTGRLFEFRWREDGGPKVHPPQKEGFGSYLIQNGLPDAKVALEYAPDGLSYTVTLSADAVRSE